MTKARQNKRGFTLIEMLLVIVIIAILVALLFPAIKQALIKAETAKAKTTVLSIATAFKAFNSQYGYWPKGASCSPQPMTTTILNDTDNPLGITFLDYSQKDINSSLQILDPWKQPYQFSCDMNYNNNSAITNCAGTGGSGTIKGGVAVWSIGPDGACGTSITSW